MTNKIEEIKEKVIKLLQDAYSLGAGDMYSSNILNYNNNDIDLSFLDQLDLKTEKDKLKIELADIVFDYFTKLRVANNWHEVLTAINEKCKQIQEPT